MTNTPPTEPTSDARSPRIAWIALALAIAGVILSLLSFLFTPWIGLVLVLVLAAAMLLAAFIFGVVALAGKRHGGTVMSVISLVLSLIGGFVGAFALIVSLVALGAAATGSSGGGESTPDPAPTTTASESATGSSADAAAAATAAGEAAFLADVRPKVAALLYEIDRSVSSEIAYPDENLIMIGKALVATGEAGIDSFVDQALSSAGDAVDADQLRGLFQSIYDSARVNLK